MKLVYIEKALVPEVWPYIKHLVLKAMERGGLGSFVEIEKQVFEGNSILWAAWEDIIHAVAITQIQETEFSKTCVIQACGGRDSANWLFLLDEIEHYARRSGCGYMRIFGRRGWQTKLRLMNYSAKKIILEKEL